MEKERKRGNRIPKEVMAPSMLYYSEKVRFAQHIQRYLKYFPKEQIKIVLFDDFAERPIEVYKDLCRFLEVSEEYEPDLSVKNPNKTNWSRAFTRLLKDPEFPVKKLIRRSISKDTQERIYSFLQRLNTKIQKGSDSIAETSCLYWSAQTGPYTIMGV